MNDAPEQEPAAGIDLKDNAVKDNKSLHYGRLLEKCPVHFNEDLGEYIVAKHADVVNIVNSPEIYKNSRAAPQNPMATTPVLPTADEPEHTLQRLLVQRAFTSGAVKRLETTVTSIAHELVDRFIDRGECNLISAYAYPLPMEVLCLLFGVEYGDADFKKWANEILDMTTHPDTATEQALQSFQNFSTYILEKASERKAMLKRGEALPEDLLSALVSPGKNGETLPEEIFIVASAQLLIGGHESTQNMIGNAIYLLLKHPEQLEALRNQPDLAENVIEEVLRFESPIQGAWRRPIADSEVSGCPIPEDSRMFVLYGSANRDPEVFTNPHEFNIRRDKNELKQHLGFGRGIHFCLGAHLARLEGRIAVQVLLERIPNLQLDESSERVRSITHFMNGFIELPVKWTPPA